MKKKRNLGEGYNYNNPLPGGQTPPLGNGFPALGFVADQGWEKRRPSTQVLWEKPENPNIVVYLKLVSVVSKYRYISKIWGGRLDRCVPKIGLGGK